MISAGLYAPSARTQYSIPTSAAEAGLPKNTARLRVQSRAAGHRAIARHDAATVGVSPNAESRTRAIFLSYRLIW